VRMYSIEDPTNSAHSPGAGGIPGTNGFSVKMSSSQSSTTMSLGKPKRLQGLVIGATAINTRLNLPPFLTQPVETQNPSKGELSHGVVEKDVHEGVQAGGCTVVLPVEKFSSSGQLCLNSMCQPRGQLQLDSLKQLLNRSGRLSVALIDADPQTPGARIYSERFGSMYEVYRRIGYEHGRRVPVIELTRQVSTQRRSLVSMIVSNLTAEGVSHAARHSVRAYSRSTKNLRYAL
jgi:hypothetical protein